MTRSPGCRSIGETGLPGLAPGSGTSYPASPIASLSEIGADPSVGLMSSASFAAFPLPMSNVFPSLDMVVVSRSPDVGLSSNSGASGASFSAGSVGGGVFLFSAGLPRPACTVLAGFVGAAPGLTGFVGMPPRGAPPVPPPGVGDGGVFIPEEVFGVLLAAGSVVVWPRTPLVRFCELSGDFGFLGSVLGDSGVLIPVVVFGVWSMVGRFGLCDSFVVAGSLVGVLIPLGETVLGFGRVGSDFDTSVLMLSVSSFGVLGVVIEVSGVSSLPGLNLDGSVVVSIFGRLLVMSSGFGVFGVGVDIPSGERLMSGIFGVFSSSVLRPGSPLSRSVRIGVVGTLGEENCAGDGVVWLIG